MTAVLTLVIAFCCGCGAGRTSKPVEDWRRAAEQGDARAQCNLGVRYYYGEGVPRDYAEELTWYHKAAEQGHARAQFNLGVYYARDEGVPRDYAKALKWYRKAADQGDAPAQCNLGVCYAHGLGVPRDHAEAVKWYRKAAGQGDANAQFNLGLAYLEGQGVPNDLVLAYKWLHVAGIRDADARARRQRLAKSMTREQIAEGQRLAREWLETEGGHGKKASTRGPIASGYAASGLEEYEVSATESGEHTSEQER